MPSACISTCFFFSNLLLCVNLVIPGPKLRPCSANSVTSLLHSMTNFSRSQVAHHMTHTRRNIWFQAYSSNMTPRKRSKCPLILPLSVSVHFSDLCNYTERVIFGFSVQIEYIKIVIMKGRCILWKFGHFFVGEYTLGLHNTCNRFIVVNLMKDCIMTAVRSVPHFACQTQRITPSVCFTSRAENLAEIETWDSSLNIRQ
jgi:hypothetical protein